MLGTAAAGAMGPAMRARGYETFAHLPYSSAGFGSFRMGVQCLYGRRAKADRQVGLPKAKLARSCGAMGSWRTQTHTPVGTPTQGAVCGYGGRELGRRWPSCLALRGAFEAPEYVEGCRRAADGLEGWVCPDLCMCSSALQRTFRIHSVTRPANRMAICCRATSRTAGPASSSTPTFPSPSAAPWARP